MINDINLIGNDENCPCESGLRFDSCCKLNITGCEDNSVEQFRNDKHITRHMREEYKGSNVLLCLHPNHNECYGKIIEAHSIQNNGVLSKLAVDKHVLVIDHVCELAKTVERIPLTQEYIDIILNSPEGSFEEIKEKFGKAYKEELQKYCGYQLKLEALQPVLKYAIDRKGKNEATVFTGFCSSHDSKIFSPIENYAYNEEKEQDFLFAYRAFSQEYHEKLRSMKEIRKIFKSNPGLYNQTKFVLDYRYRQLDEKYMNELKPRFDQAIANKDYDIFETIRRKLPKPYDFAVTAMIAPEMDLNGNILYDRYVLEGNNCKCLYLTVFPTEHETIVLISWLKEDSMKFSDYRKQILDLTEGDFKNYLNNFIPAYTPNIVLSPRLWEKQSETEKAKFLKTFENANEAISSLQHNPIDLSKKRKETLKTYDRFLGHPDYDLFK